MLHNRRHAVRDETNVAVPMITVKGIKGDLFVVHLQRVLQQGCSLDEIDRGCDQCQIL